ncbi:hypothetical protein CSKR_112802 [Clonorchis sinensis]|uniref:Uncharacterized protein n=1 Tax=Clonorchis sinensis TaxID=79923 RepID=A0A3R7FNL8_CLOSI|nr:hypothetical protein CSKR_112802 [Clonorchis sinensis]
MPHQQYPPLHSKRGKKAQWLEREFTDWKFRGSTPTTASQLPLSRLGQPGSIPALVFPSGGLAVRRRKGATAELWTNLDYPKTRNHSGPRYSWLSNWKVLGYPTVNRNTLLIRFSKLHIRHFRYSVTDRLKQPDADSTVLTRPMPYV